MKKGREKETQNEEMFRNTERHNPRGGVKRIVEGEEDSMKKRK